MIKTQNNKNKQKPNRLNTLTYEGKTYFIDRRLNQFRTLGLTKPIEFISFMSTKGRFLLAVYNLLPK